MAAYSQLEKFFARLHSLDHASAILMWDEAVMMPSGSGDARAETLAELKVMRHEILVSSELSDLVAQADDEKQSLNAWQQANVREMKSAVAKARAVEKRLVEAISLATSRCEQSWRVLRHDNNWKDFFPLFEKVVSLSREEATQRADFSGMPAYDCLLDQFSPGLTSPQIDELFGQIKAFLPDLIQRIVEQQKSIPIICSDRTFSIESQKALGLTVMKALGFNFSQGRLDVSHHPFCGGVPQDVRITTRYNTDNFIESLMGVVHETGHACYEQGLPKEWLKQPVGLARGMHLHESQSLLYEVYIGRSRAFLKHIYPLILKHLNGSTNEPFWTFDNIYGTINQVKQTYIRVNADEVTYPAHVVLRYELERDLIGGKIETKDLPELWDQKMKSYLGLSTAGNDRDGCMQDMHWPSGAFGYFPSYSIGALIAAQIYSTLERAIPNLEGHISSGQLHPIHQWLENHIWRHGSFSSFNDLILQATGEPLNTSYFKKHIEKKYLT